MSDITLTVKEVENITGLSRTAITKYITGAREPQLPAEKEIVNGHTLNKIRRVDFESWWETYQAKEPFGARLHANAGRKRKK
jgi:hypothetical protein